MMDFLDIRTILFSFTIVNLICAFVLFFLWRQNAGRYPGLGYWMADFVLNFIGLLFLALRGIVPDILSMLVGNLFLVIGIWVLLIGVERFYGLKRSQVQNIIAVGVFIVVQFYFIFIKPDLNSRNIIFSAVMVFFCAQISWMLFRIDNHQIKRVTRGLAVVSIVYLGLGVFRIIAHIFVPSGETIFESGLIEKILYLSFQMIYIVLTFFLFLMVNRRLFFDLDADIQMRTQAEYELAASQEKFSKAFDSNPDSVIISRMSDGKVIDANVHFLKESGYSKEELLENTTLSINLWVDPNERTKVVKKMEKNGRVNGYEFDGRYKDGKIVRLLYSGVVIRLNDENCLISYLQDITEKKRHDQITQIRLSLWEFASDHSLIELMQKTLDEVENITHSKIGFFHIIEEDNQNIILHAWSTRTKETYCKAEGVGMHYPIDSAGVWCDAVRRKRPIIHNDYDAVPEKKGLPLGHARLTRELVVPIIRSGRVEAVLGIGNKASDYTEKDVEIVYEIADLVWVIIQESIQEEKVLELNTKLEKLAMTDELTGLINRRAFYLKGTEELSRSKRYHIDLSIIMLDIDRFKKINDTYGHDAGDQALKCLAEVLRKETREVDIVGRLGGEEFAIILPNTPINSALRLAERLRQAIQEEQCILDDPAFRMTASLGVAFYEQSITKIDDFIERADVALYEAKHAGRNQVKSYITG